MQGHMTRIVAMAIFAGLTLISNTAQAQDLQQQVAELKAQLAAQQQMLESQQSELRNLRNQQSENWMSDARRKEVRRVVDEALADADKRMAMHDGQVVAGHNGSNFYLKSADGNFLLKFAGMIQVRYVFSHRENAPSGTPDDNRGGLELSRTRFGFIGHVFDPSWRYVLWTGYGSTGSNAFLDAYIAKDFDNGLSVQAGQFKVPFWREYLVSEKSQQFVERSLLTSGFSCGYSQGVMLSYKNEWIHVAAAFTDGRSTGNTSWDTADTEWAISGRGDVKILGDWKNYKDFESFRGDDPLWVIGGGVHAQQSEYGTPTTGETTEVRWTVDSSMEFGGGNIFIAAVGTHQDANSADDISQIGFLVQGGYFLTEDFEVIGRYEWANADATGEEDLSLVTLGFNYFFRKHNLKFTSDIGYAFNAVGDTFDSSKAGWQVDSAGSGGQVVVRSQLQLLF